MKEKAEFGIEPDSAFLYQFSVSEILKAQE